MAELLQNISGHVVGRDPRIVLRNAPEDFAGFVDWAGHVRSTVLTAGVDPERTLRYLRRMFDSSVEPEALLESRGKEEMSLDIRLFSALQASLQNGPTARRYASGINRECTFENSRFGAGRFAWRLLEKHYRHTARIMAQELSLIHN